MKNILKDRKPSNKAKALSARLMAVQGVYQAHQNDQTLKSVLAEYLEHRIGMEEDGEKIIQPDGALLSNILNGVAEREADLKEMVSANITRKDRTPDILIGAILMCAAYELMAHHDIDSPVIINDYLNVTHGFYEAGEAGLVNAILDNISKGLRS